MLYGFNITQLAFDAGKFTECKIPCGSFKKQGKPQHNIVNRRLGYGPGVLQVLDSFIHRNTATQCKNENSNDETPEIEFLTMAERKIFIGKLLRLLQTIK